MSVADIKKKINVNRMPLVLTTGEPAGIGMDIVLQLAKDKKFISLDSPVIVLADEMALLKRYENIYGVSSSANLPWITVAKANDFNQDCDIKSKLRGFLSLKTLEPSTQFLLIHTPTSNDVVAGKLDTKNASMVMTQLELAHKLAFEEAVSGIVTAPLHKAVLIDAEMTLEDGSMFTGHTEFFMQKSGCEKVVMMLANEDMKVALVTTHLPLRDVAAAITKKNVRQTVQIVVNDLQQKFGLSHPKILVCGLNPHAGEGGHLGMEEIEIINPVLKEFQDKGHDISLAMPADTLFTKRHLDNCDAVIAMYHDQGLPVLKSHGFGNTVNLTLGLPYIRTSVDHGTALDLAGTGEANSSSLWEALVMADKMSKPN